MANSTTMLNRKSARSLSVPGDRGVLGAHEALAVEVVDSVLGVAGALKFNKAEACGWMEL